MKTRSFYGPLLLVILFSLTSFAGCRNEEPEEPNQVRRKSPTAIASVNHNDTYIKIVYGQPYKKGRDIFGGLIPYGEIWRTGANEATEMTTTKDIRFAGEPLPAGTYALFSIPERDQWTIILNSRLGQWGAFEYDPQYDVLRAQVPAVKTNQIVEAFTVQFDEVKNNETLIRLSWDSTRVRIPIGFTGSAPTSTASSP